MKGYKFNTARLHKDGVTRYDVVLRQPPGRKTVVLGYVWKADRFPNDSTWYYVRTEGDKFLHRSTEPTRGRAADRLLAEHQAWEHAKLEGAICAAIMTHTDR